MADIALLRFLSTMVLTSSGLSEKKFAQVYYKFESLPFPSHDPMVVIILERFSLSFFNILYRVER